MLSDRFGRSPVLLISIFRPWGRLPVHGSGPDAVAGLFIGRIINGATSASFSTANAYVADVTAPQDRAKAFGLMGAAFGIGFIWARRSAGVLGADRPSPAVLRLGRAGALANWLYGFFVLPRALPKERRSPALNWKRANPISAFWRLLERLSVLLGLSAVMISCSRLSHNVFPSHLHPVRRPSMGLGSSGCRLHHDADRGAVHARAGVSWLDGL